MADEFLVTTFYKFVPLSEPRVEELRKVLLQRGEALNLRGLIIIGEEGINSTVAGAPSEISILKQELGAIAEFAAMIFKDSKCHFQPFSRFKVTVRPEIVTAERPDLKPWNFDARYLPPVQWEKTLRENPGVLVLDTRNQYETGVGKFHGAVDPGIDDFGQFQKFVEQWNVPRDTKILTYCTGGIRCEKAVLVMKQAGYTNVYQLEGGILKYLEEFPDSSFEGECYVFDHRVAVDQHLRPSQRYKLCAHCGNPATVWLECRNCRGRSCVCQSCSEISDRQSCSKNCAYHLRRKLAA